MEIRFLYNNNYVVGGVSQPHFSKLLGATGWEYRYIGDFNYYIADRSLRVERTGGDAAFGNIFMDDIIFMISGPDSVKQLTVGGQVADQLSARGAVFATHLVAATSSCPIAAGQVVNTFKVTGSVIHFSDL
jgi:hypothetical protein